MYYKWHDKTDYDATVNKRSCRRFGIAHWPTGVLGWIRIPSLIAAIAGILGILKYKLPDAARLLKPLNLPSIEFCWIMLALAAAGYFLCIVCWLSKNITPDIDIYNQPDKKVSASPGRWRSL